MSDRSLKEVKEDKKGKYIWVVDRDEKKMYKMYVEKNKSSFNVLDEDKWYKWDDILKYKGYWNVVGRRSYKNLKGGNRIWRIEDGKIKRFKSGSGGWVVNDKVDKESYDRIVDGIEKWKLSRNENYNLGSRIFKNFKNGGSVINRIWYLLIKYGLIVMGVVYVFRLLKRIFKYI